MSASASFKIIDILTRRGETFAAAESCTGGGIVALLTNIPGSSVVVWGGIISYSNEAKITLLDVNPELLERDGAVSSGVAKSMAWGMRVRSAADWTVAVTGIAGPGGGTDDKPVGTVWIAWCSPSGNISAERFHFDGDRALIRKKTEDKALEGLLLLIDRQD
ncbi:MAG: damage-inducible protein CinA [Spirochaetes bacterium]|nr:MAG: damage-inducible protein CinA [Spirochaetota bacterium]